MLPRLRRLAAPLVAIILLGWVPGAARAIGVSFYTTGAFSNITAAGTTLTAGAQGIKITQHSQSVTLSFTGVGTALVPVLAVPTDNVLASFSEAFVGSTGVSFAAGTDIADFLLTIHQVLPPGMGTTGGDVTVTGKIKSLNSNGHFNIGFVPSAVLIPGPTQVLYTLTDLNGANQLEITSNPKPLTADIAIVPTPASVWGGMGMLGGLAGLGLLRRFTGRAQLFA
jgi:hypothetical protein